MADIGIERLLDSKLLGTQTRTQHGVAFGVEL